MIQEFVTSVISIYTAEETLVKWSDCWAAAYYSMFATQGFLNLSENPERKLLTFIPDLQKLMWREHVVDTKFTQAIRNNWWTTRAQTEDITVELNRRKILSRNEARGGEFVYLMDKFAFANTRCPLGCEVYPDHDHEVDFQGAHHYLANFTDKLSSIGADKRKTQGYRPDYPSIHFNIGVPITPGVIIRNGVEIITCQEHMHSNASHQYIHTPIQPVLGYESQNIGEKLAPISRGARIIRKGTTGKYTSSSAVAAMYGNSAGASVTGIRHNAMDAPMNFTESKPTSLLNEGLIIQNREEIKKYVIQHPRLGKRYCESRLRDIENPKFNPPSPAYIDQCRKSGTYVSVGDTLFMQQCSNSDKENENISYDTLKNFKPLVHIDNNYGHEPVLVPFKFDDVDVPIKSKIIKSVLFLLMHVRSLHYRYLKNTRNVQEDPLKRDVYNVFGNYVHEQKEKEFKRKCMEIEERLIEHVEADIETAQRFNITEFTPENTVALILHYLTGIMIISQRDDAFYEAANRHEEFILIQREERHRIEEKISEDILMDDFNLSAGLSMKVEDNVCSTDVLFRYSHELAYYQVVNDAFNTVETVDADNKDYKLLIYSTDKANFSVAPKNIIPQLCLSSDILCYEHQQWLIPEKTSEIICSQVICNSRIKYQCCDESDGRCQLGICLKHFKSISKRVKDMSHDGMIRMPANNVPRPVPIIQEEEEVFLDVPPVAQVIPNENERRDDGWEVPYFQQQAVIQEFPEVSNPLPPSYAPLYACGGQFYNANYLQTSCRFDYSRRMPIALQKQLMKCRSSLEGDTVPLLYPFALNRLSDHYASVNRAPIGAPPLSMFGRYGRSAVPGGLASLQDHINVVYRDPTLRIASDDDATAELFDITIDKLTSKSGIKVLFQQGLEGLHRSHVEVDAVKNSMGGFDEADARKNVNNLSNFIRRYKWDYFLTLTANDRHTPGLRVIQKQLDEYNAKMSGSTQYELDNSQNTIRRWMCRAWERVIRGFYRYIKYSPDRPFGRVQGWWGRFEFQSEGAKGNKPHFHSGLSLVPGSETKQTTIDRCDNHSAHVFSVQQNTAYHQLIRDGLIKNKKEFFELSELLELMHVHDCRVGRCQIPTGDSKSKKTHCRYRRAIGCVRGKVYDITAFKKKETLLILRELGLTYENGQRVHESLRTEEAHYCATEGDVSNPFHGMTSVILRCKHDVQICGGRFAVSYLCSYVAGIEEHKKVSLNSRGDTGEEVDIDREPFEHEKLRKCKLMAEQRRQHQGKGEPLQREISVMQMAWFLSQLSFILTDKDFIPIPTKPRDKRLVVVKGSKRKITSKLVDPQDNQLKLIKMRAEADVTRQFTETQEQLMTEYIDSEFYPDKILKFGARPPEVRIIDTLEEYFTFFTLSPCPKKQFRYNENYNECIWIDGLGNRVKIAVAHLQDLQKYVEKRIDDGEQHPLLIPMQQLLVLLSNEVTISPPTVTVKLFVDLSQTNQIISVFAHVSPTDFQSFCIHLLFILGRFITERDIFNSLSIRGAFQNAQLVQDEHNVTEEEVRAIMSQFTIKYLAYYPIGRRRFEFYLKAIYDSLKQYLIAREDVHFLSMPLQTDRAIQVRAEQQLEQMETQKLQNLVSVLYKELPEERLPPREDLLARRPCNFEPRLYQASQIQSLESAHEQHNAYTVCKNSIDSYMDPTNMSANFPLLLGPPGVGKTHVMLNATVYCLSKQLRTAVTAVTAERARLLGGEHIHTLFSLAVEDKNSPVRDPTKTSEQTAINNAKKQERMVYLQRLQVIIIEEISMLNSHMFTSIDETLRIVKSNPKPFGGVLIIASGDHRQLPPVEGVDIFQLTEMMTTFQIVMMHQFVRSHGDQQLQTLINYLRKPNLSDAEIQQVLDIFNSPRFRNQYVPENQLPHGVLLVVGKKAAAKQIVDRHLARLRNRGHQLVEAKATDQVEVSPGNLQRSSRKRSTRQGTYFGSNLSLQRTS